MDKWQIDLALMFYLYPHHHEPEGDDTDTLISHESINKESKIDEPGNEKHQELNASSVNPRTKD